MNRLNALTGIATILIMIGAGYVTSAFLKEPPSRTTALPPPQRTTITQQLPSPQPKPPVTLVSNPLPSPKPPLKDTAPTSVTRTSPHLSNIHFHFDRSGFSQSVKDILEHHAEILLQNPSWNVLIQGHTDQEGSVWSNMKVGLRRAKAVKEYLQEKGIPAARLHVVSLGEYAPLCLESTAECREQNRRVTFSVAIQERPTPQIADVTEQPEEERIHPEDIVQPDLPVMDKDRSSVLNEQLIELKSPQGPIYFSPAPNPQPAQTKPDLTVSTLEEESSTPTTLNRKENP